MARIFAKLPGIDYSKPWTLKNIFNWFFRMEEKKTPKQTEPSKREGEDGKPKEFSPPVVGRWTE